MLKRTAFAVFALLCAARLASADPLLLPGDTPIVIDFENVEQLNVNPELSTCIEVPGTADYGCSDNWGFLRVNTISTSVVLDPNTDLADVGVTGLYSTTTNGDTEIFGIFYGIDITGCTGTAPNTCTATGGVLDLYWHEDGITGISTVAQLDPTTAAVDDVTGAAGSGETATFLVRLFFDNGILSGDETTTLTSTANLFTTFSDGAANGFMSVDLGTVGLWTNVLDGNWFYIDGADGGTTRGDGLDEFRDVKFRNTFQTILSGVAADWNGTACDPNNFPNDAPCIVGLTSSDPAEVFTEAAIPEPASLTLLGLGLAGVAYRQRRKAKAKKQ